VHLYALLPPRIVDMSSHKRKDVRTRIAKIHGHVHGIMEMVDNDRSYSEIVQQISAVKSALDRTIEVIVDDLVEDCVARTGKKDPEMSQTLQEIKLVVNRLA
jgi:DNA-binding FrmR family transcriptional regulator